MTDSTSPTTAPGLEGVRARVAAMRKHAAHVAAKLCPSKLATVPNGTYEKARSMRYGLRHIGGLTRSTFPPDPTTIDALMELGLVELANPDAAPVCGRYQPTELGTEVLGLIGGRG